MIITEIQLKNWKNFKDITAPCGKRVFLIGPNASGKSNFLDALRFLRDVAKDGIAKAVDMRGGIKALRYLNARSPSDITVSVRVDDMWEYMLSFNVNTRGEPVITSECVYKAEENKKKILLERPDDDDHRDGILLSQTALQQVNANKNFRALAEFFSSIQYRHILPQLVRDPKSFSSLPNSNDPYGRDIVSQIWNTPVKKSKARLKRTNAALAVAVPKLKNLSVELNQSTGSPHLKANYEHWRPYGAYQNESSFSDGTLRLLALLWSLFEAEGPLLLEEPELSLHEEIVHQLPGIFARMDKSRKKAPRQIFITTHAKAMLSDEGIGANEVLMLKPEGEGTEIQLAKPPDIKMMEEGLSAAEVLLPKTRPDRIDQLSLLDML